jgi:hypothetical protein
MARLASLSRMLLRWLPLTAKSRQSVVRFGCIGVFDWCCLVPVAAAAAGEPSIEAVDLSWARSPEADSCLSGSDVRRAVRARLGRDPFTEPFQKEIAGFVSRKVGRWTADIVVRDNRLGRVGNRRLDSAGADCHELDQAVILTVTLIIDPNASLQPAPAPAPETTPGQPTKVEPPRVDEPVAMAPARAEPTSAPGTITTAAPPPAAALSEPPAPTPKREAIIASRLMLAPSVAYGLLPGITPGVALRGEISLSNRLSIETSAAFFPEQRRAKPGTNTDIGYGLSALGVAGCYHPSWLVAPLACASGWIGVNHAVVYAGLPDQPGDRFWMGLRADLGLSATVGRFTADLRAFGMFPVTRWNFGFREGGPLFQQPVVAPGLEIAVGLRLP